MTTETSVEVSVSSLVAASRALTRAARFTEATELLDSATGNQAELAVAKAEAAVAHDWYRGTQFGTETLEAAAKAAAYDNDASWDVDFLTVRHRYGQLIFTDDEENGTRLLRQLESVAGRAPDDGRRGWAEMYTGLILDNVLQRRDQSPVHYEMALELGEKTGDDYLVFEALRHLGDHSHDDGDEALTRERWERSAEAAARAGVVIGTLAQQLLLAQLARESGDEAGARLLAREISRWTGAVGAERHRASADAFLAGEDPTKPPAEDETT